MGGTGFTAVDVLKARKAVDGSITRTPLTHSKALSDVSGAEVHIKWENLQRTGSYKVRGALYRMSLLSEEERRRGVITASAGNWALGVALGARSLGIRATICVPANTPKVKVSKCEALGAEVVLHGSYFDEAFAHCQELARGGAMTFISGTDDYDVMAGHGTVGVEILEDLPDVGTIVCPVGGGGLLSGIATWSKTVSPSVRIMGAQSTAAHTLHECFRAKRLVEVPVPPTLCEGLAGGITQLNLDLALRWFDDVVLAEEEKLRDTIIWLMRNERQVVEGSGAVGPAAIIQGKVRFTPGEKVAVVVSGGNIDLDRIGIQAP
ncbi:MAG: threonine/serine dehydratase [Candidatus Thermoplasmatota archaeon]